MTEEPKERVPEPSSDQGRIYVLFEVGSDPREKYEGIEVCWATDDRELSDDAGFYKRRFNTGEPQFDYLLGLLYLELKGLKSIQHGSSFQRWTENGGDDLEKYTKTKNPDQLTRAIDWMVKNTEIGDRNKEQRKDST